MKHPRISSVASNWKDRPDGGRRNATSSGFWFVWSPKLHTDNGWRPQQFLSSMDHIHLCSITIKHKLRHYDYRCVLEMQGSASRFEDVA